MRIIQWNIYHSLTFHGIYQALFDVKKTNLYVMRITQRKFYHF